MSSIEKKFADLKRRGETALIPFVTAGDPDLVTTLKILRALDEGGADCIELGIPFSDPTADGPTIQRSSERALKNGLSLPQIFRVIHQFRRTSDVPIVLFGYFNPIFHYGVKNFCRAAAHAEADGILCVDLPPEESAELKRWTDAEGLDLIFLLSPTSGLDRVQLVAREARGFIYYVSVTGVTGARQRSMTNSARKSRGYAGPRRCPSELALESRLKSRLPGSPALPTPPWSAARWSRESKRQREARTKHGAPAPSCPSSSGQ